MKDLLRAPMKADPGLSAGLSFRNDHHFVTLFIEAAKSLYKVESLEELPKVGIDKVISNLIPLVTTATLSPSDEVVIFSDPLINKFFEPELKEFKESLESKCKMKFAVSHSVLLRNIIIIVTNSDTSDIYPSFYPVRHSILGVIMVDPETYPKPPSLTVNF